MFFKKKNKNKTSWKLKKKQWLVTLNLCKALNKYHMLH